MRTVCLKETHFASEQVIHLSIGIPKKNLAEHLLMINKYTNDP